MCEVEDRKAEAEATQHQITLCRQSSSGRLQLIKKRYYLNYFYVAPTFNFITGTIILEARFHCLICCLLTYMFVSLNAYTNIYIHINV
jgi:hypothetical protein